MDCPQRMVALKYVGRRNGERKNRLDNVIYTMFYG
jgi:hypothetical protein